MTTTLDIPIGASRASESSWPLPESFGQDMYRLEYTVMLQIPTVPRNRVVETQGVCGGAKRIEGTRIPVWGIEAARLAGISTERILEMYPTLSRDDVRAAFEYAESHVDEIQAQIADSRDG